MSGKRVEIKGERLKARIAAVMNFVVRDRGGGNGAWQQEARNGNSAKHQRGGRDSENGRRKDCSVRLTATTMYVMKRRQERGRNAGKVFGFDDGPARDHPRDAEGKRFAGG